MSLWVGRSRQPGPGHFDLARLDAAAAVGAALFGFGALAGEYVQGLAVGAAQHAGVDALVGGDALGDAAAFEEADDVVGRGRGDPDRALRVQAAAVGHRADRQFTP